MSNQRNVLCLADFHGHKIIIQHLFSSCLLPSLCSFIRLRHLFHGIKTDGCDQTDYHSYYHTINQSDWKD